MRQLLLDTETTGLDPKMGHRIIEIAAVELVNRRLTGRHLHFRLDPERDIDFAATEVHGLTRDDLRGKPRFREVAGEFVDFSRGCEWIIHNAAFDVAFFDYEFDLCGFPRSTTIYGKLVDTLALARSFAARDSGADGLPRYVIHCIIPDAAELAAHRSYLEALARESKSGCLWLSLEQEAQSAYEPEVALPA